MEQAWSSWCFRRLAASLVALLWLPAACAPESTFSTAAEVERYWTETEALLAEPKQKGWFGTRRVFAAGRADSVESRLWRLREATRPGGVWEHEEAVYRAATVALVHRLLARGAVDDAEAVALEFVEHYPGWEGTIHLSSHTLLGERIYVEARGQPERAMALYEGASLEDPAYAPLWAMALDRVGDRGAAVAVLRRAVIGGAVERLPLMTADLLENWGEGALAERFLRERSTLEGDAASMIRYAGRLIERRERRPAEALLRRAIERFPTDPAPYASLAAFLETTGRAREIEALWRSASAHGLTDLATREVLALHARTDNFSARSRWIKERILKEPADPAWWKLLARHYSEFERDEEAVTRTLLQARMSEAADADWERFGLELARERFAASGGLKVGFWDRRAGAIEGFLARLESVTSGSQLTLENRSAFRLEDIRVEINPARWRSGFSASVASLDGGERVRLPLARLADRRNRPFDLAGVDIQRIEVRFRVVTPYTAFDGSTTWSYPAD
ncbi:MAG: hypothetical protein JJT96_11490 [Opitutales bacterium]|nr:hypothetical protein [Opitutales bacterium]